MREPELEKDRGKSDAADWVRETLAFWPDAAQERVLASGAPSGEVVVKVRPELSWV